MDTARGYHDARPQAADAATDGGVGEATLSIGGDERRMHVRAYNHWVSLLKGRAYPSIEDLDPAGIVDFGAHSVLLDFSQGIDDPAIPFLGAALRRECDIDLSIGRIAEVPARSLLSRLTDHYLQIIANRAPIGFEAEFVNARGHTTMYRGILMPFSSDEDSIDFIYGVINWKEVADPATQAGLNAELAAAVRSAPSAPVPAPVWADGPSAETAEPDVAGSTSLESLAESLAEPLAESLADRLVLARESAAAVDSADGRSRAALYRALGRAHDFACAVRDDAESYREMLDDAGIKAQARAPMTPIVKLVFGAAYDKTRLTEFAAVLSHADRHDVATGGLDAFLDAFPGGIKRVVQAERAARRPAKAKTPVLPRLDDRAAVASIAFGADAAAGELMLLVARADGDGRVDILGLGSADPRALTRAVRSLQ